MRDKYTNTFRKVIRLFSHGQLGSSLIELLLAVGLIGVVLPILLAGFTVHKTGQPQMEQRIRALALLSEGQEAARVFREKDWSSFVADSSDTCTSVYHPMQQSNTWTLVTGNETVSGFTRKIQVCNVYRDFTNSNSPIVAKTAPNASLDSSTIQVITTVSWATPIATSISSSEYLTRNENLSYLETNVTNPNGFGPGSTLTNTVIRQTSGADGEVVLGAGIGNGDWCAPSLTLATQDLPKSGIANGIYAIEGTVFAATGNNSSGVSFAKVNVTTTYPPVPTLQSTYDGFKTNGIFGETNYAYIATDTNSREVDIVNLNSVVGGKYQEAGWFDAPGNGSGNSVYVFGNIGFMTDGTKLYTFDLSSKTGSRGLPLGSANITGTGNRVVVAQDPISHNIYAFVASTSTSNQLQIFQVSSNGRTINLAGSKGITAQGATDLFVSPDGSRVYLTTAYSASQNDVFILNTSNKGSISVMSSTTTNGMNPKGITFIQNRVIVVGTGGTYQYQVFKVISDAYSNCDATDSTVGKLAVGTGINGVSSVFQTNGDAFSYIITGDASSELKIIRGGAGGNGGLYAPTGIFQSKTFDAGHTVAFNYFKVHDQTVPGTTSIFYEITIKPGQVGGSCGVGVTCCLDVPFGAVDFTQNPFVPPTSLPFKTTSSYTSPGQCLQYRATFNTADTSTTPILNDVQFNYSP